LNFCNVITSLKTRILRLHNGESHVIVKRFLLKLYHNVIESKTIPIT